MSIAQTWLVRKIGSRNRARDVVEGPAADAERVGLFRQRQGMLTVNHLFALSKPALTSNWAPVRPGSSRASQQQAPPWPRKSGCGSGGVVSSWYLLFEASRCIQAGHTLIPVVQIARAGPPSIENAFLALLTGSLSPVAVVAKALAKLPGFSLSVSQARVSPHPSSSPSRHCAWHSQWKRDANPHSWWNSHLLGLP